MRIGLMGGTFDPIHFGHLFIAEEARIAASLSEVVFVPNRQPAHIQGKQAVASPEARLRLTQIATESNPYFSVSTVEMERPGPSYLIDTVHHFLRQGGADLQVMLIVGADALADVMTWHRGSELFELCSVAAARRPGFSLEQASAGLNAAQMAKVQFLETPDLYVASKGLRQRIREGRPVRYLTPDAVQHEIERLGLYL